MTKARLILGVLIVFMLSSCSSNEPAGYTTWHCAEISENGSRTYLVDMYRTKADTTVYLLSNFHNISVEGLYDVKVKLSNHKITFTPTPQQIGSSMYVIQSGSGTMNANSTQIDFSYNIYDANKKSEISVHATYTR